MVKRMRRADPRQGYDGWAASYDRDPNPVVALDRRHTPGLFGPRPGERVLDAACGTGGHLPAMLAAGARPVGLDLSRGMLGVARRRLPGVPLGQADLEAGIPLRRGSVDAVLCALVGEHLRRLGRVFGETRRVLRAGGRLLFSVFHPELARAGIEANFERDGVEIRLGAEHHGIDDYCGAIEAAGFGAVTVREFAGDEGLAREVPGARKFVGVPVLLVIEARAG